MEVKEYEVIIIGGGPAGYSAGIYTTRGMLKTLLIESYTVLSQLALTDLIENYPGFHEGIGGYDLLSNFKKQGQKFGLEVVDGIVEEIKHDNTDGKSFIVITKDKKFYKTKSLILASGAKTRKLGIPGEKEFAGKGVSYCAVCDGAFYKNRHVAVVGGGDTALQEALYLTKFASKVSIIHRRDKLRAEKILQEQVFNNEKISFIWDSIVEKIEGNDIVENLKLKNKKTDGTTNFACDGIFIFIGVISNTDYINRIVETDNSGWVITDEKMRTNIPGIFAAGDLRADTYRQIATAVGDGVTAALSCEKYISKLKGTEYI